MSCLKTDNKNILFEGQDDIKYFHSTFKAANGYSLPVSNISCDSATNIPAFVELLYGKITKKKLENKSLFCLLDNDDSGRKAYKKIKSKKYVNSIKTISLYLDRTDNQNDNYPSMIEDLIIPEIFFEAVILYLREKRSSINISKFKVENFIKDRKAAKRTPMPEFLNNYFDSVIKNMGKFSFTELSIKYGISLKYEDIILNKKRSEIEIYKNKYPELVSFLNKFI